MMDWIKSVCNYYLLEREDNLLEQMDVFSISTNILCGNYVPVSIMWLNNHLKVNNERQTNENDKPRFFSELYA